MSARPPGEPLAVAGPKPPPGDAYPAPGLGAALPAGPAPRAPAAEAESAGEDDACGRRRRRRGPGGAGPGRRRAREPRSLRLSINARERRRMHDLNDALDGLRAVIPYAHSPAVRKLSKIATLLLARNHILTQARALDDMRRLLGCVLPAAPLPAAPLPAAPLPALAACSAPPSALCKHCHEKP